ncbi:MAG TPA: acyltransferase [Dongiaceae bacterium]|nr:acyltransferase [Dongiaceae bacterium]
MFGTFRLLLALMVVQSHFAGGGLGGPVAVFGFFCLSGYLMTKIVNESYSDGLSGYLRFLGNRALRIYPAYYAAVVFAAGVLLLWPIEARTAAGWYMLPQDWLQTFSIIGLQPRSPILLVPAWSLHVEIIHFILIGALFGRSRMLTALWFFCALALTIFAILRGASFDWLYFTPYGSSVAFAAGAMIHQYREKLPVFSPKLAIAACCMLVAVSLRMPLEVAHAGGLHASIFIAALSIIALKNMPAPRWDSALGDLAYPVFLLHIPCRAAMSGLLGRSDAWVDVLAVAATIILSYFIVAVVERPLSLIRTKLRSADAMEYEARRVASSLLTGRVAG